MGEQSDDHAEILALIHANRISLWTQDFDTYEKCFVHAPYTTRWGWWRPGGTFVRHGWDSIFARVREQFSDPQLKIPTLAFDTKVENLVIRIGVDMAWATFDQVHPGKLLPDHIGPGLTREVRFFERHDGQWRIAFLGFLDNDAHGDKAVVLRLDADGTVLWKSPAAIEALENDDDLVIRGGKIRIRDARADQKLQAAIRWAAQLDSGVMSRHGALPIVLDAGEGVPSRVWWVIADGGMILFSMDQKGIAEDRLEVAAVIYGLSAAQKRLAALVAEGLSLAEIAERMAISANTARTHLNRVFDKTGVRTQAALVRVLLSTAAPV
jgi:DNA-binding CsgD family transcriptional regulator